MTEDTSVRKSKGSDPELRKVVSKARRDLEGWGKKSKRGGSAGSSTALLAGGGAIMIDGGGGYDCGGGADGGCDSGG